MVAGLASIITSRISSAMTGSFLSLLLFGRFGQVLEAPQASGPVLVEKPTEPVHFAVVGPVEAAGAVSPLDHEFRLTKDTEVLRDGGSGDITEPGGDLGRRHLFVPDQPE